MKKIKLTCIHILILVGVIALAIFWSNKITKETKNMIDAHNKVMKTSVRPDELD